MKQDFQTWWDERYFYNSHPLYKSYKRLSDLGSDFVYVDFLCSTLLFGDEFAQRIWRKGKSNRNEFAPFHEPVMAAIKLTAAGVVFLTIKLLQERKLLDFSLDPDKIISHDEIMEMTTASHQNWVLRMAKRIEEDEDKKLEPGWRVVDRTPVLKLLVTLLPKINVSIARKGRRADPCGSFFLLALTEHLRERSRKPHWLEAQRLLRKLRRSQSKPGILERQTAMVRVAKFKREYSKPSSELFPSWKDLLTLLNEQFQLWTNQERTPSEVIKWFDAAYHKPIVLPRR